MPYKIRKLPNQNRYRITNAHNGKVVAKSTTKEKADKMLRLLGMLMRKEGGMINEEQPFTKVEELLRVLDRDLDNDSYTSFRRVIGNHTQEEIGMAIENAGYNDYELHNIMELYREFREYIPMVSDDEM